MSEQTHLPPRWRERLLQLVGAKVNPENLRFLNAWQRAEGGTAKWNPLNTTYPLPFKESWSYNSTSVQNYWRATGGIAATALTLIEDRYAGVLGDLQAGTKTAEQIAGDRGAQIKTWGTNPELILQLLAE